MKNSKVALITCVGVMVFVTCMTATLQATDNYDRSMSLLNPFSPANRGAALAVERSLRLGLNMNHNGLDSLTSPSMFVNYDFGKNDDKRTGGFDNYFNSYTVGMDAFDSESTLWGLLVNYSDEQGSNGAGTHDNIDTWASTLYMSRTINETMFWGTSLTFSKGETDIRGGGTTDADSYVIAPYMTMMTEMDSVTYSLSPSYVLGYQKLDYPSGAVDSKDNSLMGRFVLMGRASMPISEKTTLTGNLGFNQVLHNHGLDTESNNDHQWFTTGISMDYMLNENTTGSIGYLTEFDSAFSSDIFTIGLNIAF